MKIALRVLLILVALFLVVVGWAWWFYRPTIEYVR
jgi:hypothetical protein